MGGQLQTLFGILGHRAFVIEPNVSRHANAHWLPRPLDSEVPPNRSSSVPLNRSKVKARFKDPRASCSDCDYW